MKEELKNLDKEEKKTILEAAKILLQDDSEMDEHPDWYDFKKSKIDEVAYCSWFISKHPLRVRVPGTVKKNV